MIQNDFKISEYNYFQLYNDKVICLNGITNRMIVLKKEEHDTIFNKLIIETDFKTKYHSLSSKLEEWGFIIPINKNEIDFIITQNRKQIFLDSYYWLTINPTLECNFKCWYCSVDYANTKFEKRRMSDETIINVKKFLNNFAKRNINSGLHLDWFGGEPLLYFDDVVYPISKYAIKKMGTIKKSFSNHATTNAYLITDKLIKKFSEINLNSFQITIDGDEQRHNKIRNENNKESYRTIVNNVKKILNNIDNSKIILRINYDKKTLNNLFSLYDEFNDYEKEKFQIDFQRVWQVKPEDGENELLKENIEYCKSKNINVKYFAYKPGTFHTCYSDKYHHAVINYDGNIFKCTARDYSEKHKAGLLNNNGEIEWNENFTCGRFTKATFENKHCLTCKILPLCFGPCSQRMIEVDNEVSRFECTKDFTELSLSSYLIAEAKNRKILI